MNKREKKLLSKMILYYALSEEAMWTHGCDDRENTFDSIFQQVSPVDEILDFIGVPKDNTETVPYGDDAPSCSMCRDYWYSGASRSNNIKLSESYIEHAVVFAQAVKDCNGNLNKADKLYQERMIV